MRGRALLRMLHYLKGIDMKRHYGQTKAQRQADWLAKFADALLARRPGLSGHIDWDAAKHYYFPGADVADAVDQYCIARGIV